MRYLSHLIYLLKSPFQRYHSGGHGLCVHPTPQSPILPGPALKTLGWEAAAAALAGSAQTSSSCSPGGSIWTGFLCSGWAGSSVDAIRLHCSLISLPTSLGQPRHLLWQFSAGMYGVKKTPLWWDPAAWRSALWSESRLGLRVGATQPLTSASLCHYTQHRSPF